MTHCSIRTVVTLVLGLAGSLPAWAIDYVGGAWGDADLILADGDRLEGTFQDVGNLVIPAGATVDVGDGTKLEIHAAHIQIDGVLDAKGAGFRGGQRGVAGSSGAGPGGALLAGFPDWPQGQGASHAGFGGTDIPPHYSGTNALPYGSIDSRSWLPMGSGGGTSSCTTYYCYYAVPCEGGRGGGSVLLQAPTVVINGTVKAHGLKGGSTPGGYAEYAACGGGSGGTIAIAAGSLLGSGELNARGGHGGKNPFPYSERAGGGSGGRVKVWAATSTATLTVDVGAGMGDDAEPGTEFWHISTPALVGPTPGTAGVSNTVTVTGAAPGVDTYLYASTSFVPINVYGCPGMVTDIPPSVFLGPNAADAAGEVVFVRTVPASQAGNTWYVQAVQADVCAKTAVNSTVF